MDRKNFVLATLLQSTQADIDDYKRWIGLLSQLAQNPAYGAANVLEWIKIDKFNDYLIYKSENTVKNAMSSAPPDINVAVASRITPKSVTTLPMRRSRSPSVESVKEEEVHSFHPPLPLDGPILMEIASSLTPVLAPDVVAPPLRDIINLCTSESESEPIKLESSHMTPPSSKPPAAKPAGRFAKGTKIVITRKEKVDRVVHLSEIPARWPVADVDTAYVLDFSKDSRHKRNSNGKKPKGFDEFLKKEDQDSYGKGTNGSTSRDTALTILGDIPCRRSIHTCNGGHMCEFFDPKVLADYQRTNGEDMSLTREIFVRELRQNQTDSGSAAGRTASFFRVVQGYKKKGCMSKSECNGIPVLRKLNAPSNDGKLRFIGCSKWVTTEKWSHTYAAIPADVDENLLAKFMSGSELPPAELEAHNGDGHCARLTHPRHGKKSDCPHVHFQDGVSVAGKMIHHPCTAKKIVYTSKDPSVPKCVVIFRGLHSHPPWPAEKPGHAAKEDVKRCMDAAGGLGETGAHITQAVLGASIDVKHPAFRDTRRRLRDEVSKLKSDGTPAGLLWAGILADYEDNLKLPLAQRYVHHVCMSGETKIAVAMNPELAALLHDDGVRFIQGDITFKRTKGEMNEWEAVIWYTLSFERVTVSRIYTNAYSKEAFTHLFDAFFSTVKKVTGKAVRFKAFDPKGNIYSIHFDMEAAQVQGLGAWLSNMVMEDPALRALFPCPDPDKLVQFVVKLCSVHLERSTDALVPIVGQETVNYVNSIRGLSDPEDIANWNNFCSTHENKMLRDWHTNKVQYPWLLPGYNESLSSFPKGFWQQSPSHTNLVESAHVASNKGTKINLLPVESVRKARIFDAEKAASIAAAREACILVNRHNQDQVRMARNVTRTAKRKSYRQKHGDVGTSILETQAELAALNASKKDAAAQLKELKSQKKELGRVPRHSTASRTGSSTSIPKLVEPDVPSSPAGPLMSSSPFSSPVPMLHPLDETDIEYGSGSYDDSFGVDLPMNDFGGSPLWTITDEELDAAFAAAAFNSNNLEPMVKAGGFEQQWQAAVNTGFDQELQAILDAVQFSAPADDWPTLPPALPLSPPLESTPSRADSPVPTLVAPEPAPAPRKRQREEVDLRNVLDQPRARKVRKREW
ncbi:hypothetical protein C8J57DRAFT_1583306 [Mycena rebaudengoi]|nr:hypothetical protein C8J57DRAFT_1583306 [Mycena rebaudengoi]